MNADALLEVQDLRLAASTEGGAVYPVREASLYLRAGEAVALVGESGSGKTMLCRSLCGLLPSAVRIESGTIRLGETEIHLLDEPGMQQVRGKRVGMVFQDALSALNPVLSIGFQLTEAVRQGDQVSKKEARTRAIDLLSRVGIPDAQRKLRSYPHEFSGGMRQRVMIAMAIAPGPELLLADEPTTALDVTVQAQILELLANLQEDYGMALLLVSHDLGVVANVASRIMVMYSGGIVESGDVKEVYTRPAHPYTRALISCTPSLEPVGVMPSSMPGSSLPIESIVPGCRFAPRCMLAKAECDVRPPLRPVQGSEGPHLSACHFAESVAEMAILA